METRYHQIDQITRDFIATFSHLSEKEINWKPDPGIWSIAQNIDHLIVINSTYYPIIEAAHNKTLHLPFLAKISFIPRKMGDMLLKAVSPENQNKARTFPVWEPAYSDLSVDIIKKFYDHQEILKKAIDDSAELMAKKQVIHSPASPYIVYYLSTAFDIIIAHERRHLKQAKSVLATIVTS